MNEQHEKLRADVLAMVRDRAEADLAEQVDAEVADLKAALGVTGGGPSEPGGDPHKRSGRLQAGIGGGTDAAGDEVRGSVYSDVPYAPFLQEGTDRMAARPFLTHSLARLEKRIDQNMGTKGE